MDSLPSQREARAATKELLRAQQQINTLREALGAATAAAAAADERCAALTAALHLGRCDSLALRTASADLAVSEGRCAALLEQLESAASDNAALRLRVTSLQLQLHLLRPQRAHAATSPIPHPAQAHVGTSPAARADSATASQCSAQRARTLTPPSPALARAPASAERRVRASSPLRSPAAPQLHSDLRSLAPAGLLSARDLWARWLELGEPQQFDMRLYTEMSRGPFQRYKSFARVARQLSLNDSVGDPIEILDLYLGGNKVCVVRHSHCLHAAPHSASTQQLLLAPLGTHLHCTPHPSQHTPHPPRPRSHAPRQRG
jgi:hypothetical protein